MTIVTQTAKLGIFDRIVCGVDGTTESLEAARQAARLRASEGRLTVASVAEIDAAVHAGWAMTDVLEEIDTAARDALHRAVDEVDATGVRLLAGGVVPSLLRELERANATLVAVGPRGHSRPLGMLVGGVATELLHEASCSVLLSREPRFGTFPSSILVGVDGSPESLVAAEVAGSLAERFGSELVSVVALGGRGVELAQIQQLSPSLITDPSHPVKALSDLSHEADLVVIGSRGLHGPKALGSVSERVAHRAACSVLVVRDP